MKKLRQIRHTIFIYCEGKTDWLFVRYLKSLYLIRGSKHINIKKGSGGEPSTFISQTNRNAGVRDYDEKYIVLDVDDKTEAEIKHWEGEASKVNIQLIWQKPCLEGLFLRVLEGNQRIHEKSKACKNLFYRKYAQGIEPFTEILLNRLFSKNCLNKSRLKIEELDKLIKIIEP